MRHELRLFLVALQFLTRVPVPRRVGFDAAWLQDSLRHFPLVGAFVGACGAAVLWAAALVWPPTVAVVLSTIATVVLTGAFHEDGLADSFDALGGAVDRARALAIMKDSRIGSYGAAALVLVLALKLGSLAALAALSPMPVLAMAALVWVHAVSRAAPVALVALLPYAGDAEHAKAKPLAMQVTRAGVGTAVAWVLLLSAGAWLVPAPMHGRAGMVVAVALVVVLATTAACARWLRRRLGGFTGDTLGATQQLTEVAALLAWLAVLSWA